MIASTSSQGHGGDDHDDHDPLWMMSTFVELEGCLLGDAAMEACDYSHNNHSNHNSAPSRRVWPAGDVLSTDEDISHEEWRPRKRQRSFHPDKHPHSSPFALIPPCPTLQSPMPTFPTSRSISDSFRDWQNQLLKWPNLNVKDQSKLLSKANEKIQGLLRNAGILISSQKKDSLQATASTSTTTSSSRLLHLSTSYIAINAEVPLHSSPLQNIDYRTSTKWL